MPARGDTAPSAPPGGAVALSGGQRQWLVDGEVIVAVDGSQVWDADQRRRRSAVVVRMPADFARHLAAVLDDWTTIGRLLESCRGAEQHELAGALHTAAGVADALSAFASDGAIG